MAIRRDEVLTWATTRRNLENMMLGERSQSQKIILLWVHLYEMSRERLIQRQKTEKGIGPGKMADWNRAFVE